MSEEARPGANGHYVLTGTDGHFRHDRVDVPLGRTVVVGRSRRCDLSLRRSKTFLSVNGEEQRRLLSDRAFLRVSRRHMQITYLAPGHVEVANLSKNGTWVNGIQVDRMLITEIPAEGVVIRLAEAETLLLLRPQVGNR